jgi:hypothetical protein
MRGPSDGAPRLERCTVGIRDGSCPPTFEPVGTTRLRSRTRPCPAAEKFGSMTHGTDRTAAFRDRAGDPRVPRPPARPGRTAAGRRLPADPAHVHPRPDRHDVGRTLAGHRHQGVLHRLRTTPVGPAPLLAAQLTAHLVFAAIAAALTIAVAVAVFGVATPASWVGSVLSLALAARTLFSIGLIIGAVAPSPTVAPRSAAWRRPRTRQTTQPRQRQVPRTLAGPGRPHDPAPGWLTDLGGRGPSPLCVIASEVEATAGRPPKHAVIEWRVRA